MEFGALAAAIDRLEELGFSCSADADTVVQLERQLARLDAAVSEATAALHAAGGWASDGALNASSWSIARCRLGRTEARAQIRRGKELRRLPRCAGAWRAGEITGAHVDVIASLDSEATRAALVRDEPVLVGQASTPRFDQFARAAAYWRQIADPEGAEGDAGKQLARRHSYLVKSFDALWLGRMVLDPLSGSIVAAELERIEHQLFDADWAEAQERLGRRPQLSELARTAGQRRADALVEMAVRSRTAPADGRRPAPRFTVLVGWETLHGRICELADGTVLAPGAEPGWLDGAYLERIVFGLGNRVDVSPAVRLFSGTTRRAIEVRDRECTQPFCDVPASKCQVDHVQPWSQGGLTVQENGRLLCSAHNRSRNQRLPPDDREQLAGTGGQGGGPGSGQLGFVPVGEEDRFGLQIGVESGPPALASDA
jgi:hypothetical protein